MLLSAEGKKLCYAVRWVECDVLSMYTYLGIAIKATGQRQNGTTILMQPLHQLQTLVRDWLEGHLDTYMTTTPAMTSANWNHKTFAFRT